MSISFEFSAGSAVPAGIYKAKFVGVEDREPNEHGQSCRFAWEVIAGEFTGQQASRICGIDRKPTAKNGLGKILMGLASGPLEVGQKIDPDDCIGKVYTIQVCDAPGGNGTRVETVLPAF